MNQWNAVHQRSLSDLLEAERERRSIIEDDRTQLVNLLIELAQRYDGPCLEEHRRQQPGAPGFWTAQEWRAFFSQPPRDEHIPSWGEQKQPSPSQTTKDQPMTSTQDQLQVSIAPIAGLQPEPVVETHQEQQVVPMDISLNKTAHGPLVGFKPPRVPLKYQQALKASGLTDLRWRRGSMQLYLIATLGINAHLELDKLIAPHEGLSYRTNSTKKPLKVLSEAGLLVVQTLRLEKSGFRMALNLARLSEAGRQLCSSFGWAAVESDWDRLIQYHQGESQEAHTLAVIYFALMARSRGWATEIVPDIDAAVKPDISVIKDGQSQLVEIELGTRGDEKQTKKWHNMVDTQGYVAVCTATGNTRERLVGDCKLAKLPGMAADLQSLQKTKYHDTTSDDPLWIETWLLAPG